MKAGLLLGLLGGSKSSSGNEGGGGGGSGCQGGDFNDDDLVAQSSKSDSCFNIRADIHVLIVGDPGLGIIPNITHSYIYIYIYIYCVCALYYTVLLSLYSAYLPFK